ncbi:MAG: sigma-54-dependent transcriptional regulator [Gemmatimonadaceae bacterium]
MSQHTRVLLVDADGASATALLQLLGPAGYEVSHAASVDAAVRQLARSDADVLLHSLDTGGLAGVTRLAGAAPEAELVLLAGAAQLAVAREGLRLGACDIVERARDLDSFLFALERAAREGRMRREVATLRARVQAAAPASLVGRSPSMMQVHELIGRAAASRAPVLVTGEAGTGKDVVARLVHDMSDRAGRPFIMMRCQGTDAATLEHELFGRGRGGLFEAARGGTLVLDEFRSAPPALRTRISAVISDRVVMRAGAEARVPTDVRVVLTARTDASGPPLGGLDLLLGDHSFLAIPLPPLRERRSDIPLLVRHFRGRAAGDPETALPALAAEAMSSLMGHQWPGNVRELEHWVERIAYAGSGEGRMGEASRVGPGGELAHLDSAGLTLEALERKYILHVLRQERGHQSRAAERLGIDRRTLYRKLKEYRDESAPVQQAG